ncbi:MAG: GGDEF and EAL domain-containing protein, partial [Burkholderiales bacterium]
MNTPRRSLARQRDARDRALATHHGVHGQSGNRWLAAISALAILLLLVLSAGLLLSQRDYSLKRAQAQAQREVQRLAIELEQTLRMAQAAIEMSAHGPHSAQEGRLGVHHPLVDSLALPFDLHRLDAADAPGQPAPPNQWLPGLPQQESGAWHVPLTWLRPTAGGTETWQVRLSRDALLSRFASEVMPEGSSMSLFRIDDDGATTVLARYPTISSEQGVTVRGHLATAVARSPSGVFEAEARIDGVRRIVGYRQLAAPGQRLMVVYALGTEGVLAGWYALLPWAVLLTVLVATAMGWGSWRLARSMRELRRSERHFQTLTGHLPDVIGRYDREGRILYINPAVQKATGLAPKDMIGKSLAETGAPDSVAEQWMACLARVFATGQGETLRFDYAGPLGDRHWESQVTLEPGEAGQTPTVLVVSRDITERRDAEARRDAAQRLFESVFMAAPDPMSLGDWESGRLLLVNDAFCELFGRRREDMIGRTSTELGLWRSGEGRQALLDALASGGQVRNQAGTSVRPDGREVHVRYSAERVQVDGHDRLLLMFRDVTQLELDQRALERSELRFRLAAAHGQVWEWDFEQEGGFSPGREFFLRLGHDLDAAAPLNEVFAEVVHPEDLPRLRWQIRLFLKGERPFQMEFRARDASGTYRWFEAYASGLRDPDGRMTYMAGTAFEISDRKALEEAQR